MVQAAGKVKLNLDIYKTIIATTVRYANARIPEEDWAEVYGLLFGYNEGNDVIVTDAIPFTHTKKKGHILRVEFDEEDYALAADIETQFYDRTPPQFIVGWYHSHPGIKIMLSQDDVKNQLAWQTNNPLACALVFNHVRLIKQVEVAARKGDPVKPLQQDPGFEVYRLDDPNRGIEAAYHMIPFEFTDFKIDEAFIHNAQEFVGWVSKAFPRDDGVLTEYKKFIDTTLNKLDEIYSGTSSYVQTLVRKNESSRIASVVASQVEEASKVLEQGVSMVQIFRMMVPYLEYKERDRLVPLIEAILSEWDQKSTGFIDRLNAVATIH
jgi:proteasome lid subunit RPN8/RPN11